MAVDVVTQIEIARPRAEVAGYASEPTNAPEWYENIESVEWMTEPPLAPVARVAFVASFLGRRLEYTYEGRPFAMETTYTWDEASDGETRMTLRNRGEPSGFSMIAAPLLAGAMRRANRKDLARLKRILERA